ncbi:hypothetical protein GCM10027162_18450 [Streptomyces incanus]
MAVVGTDLKADGEGVEIHGVLPTVPEGGTAQGRKGGPEPSDEADSRFGAITDVVLAGGK